jgi:hypothetical protein
MSGSPRTAREALVAELLGDVDGLLKRVEALPAEIAKSEGQLAGTAKAMQDAGDKFRLAVTAFTDQAKTDLGEYFDHKLAAAAHAASRTVDEQRAALQEAARLAFAFEASERAGNLAQALAAATQEFRRSAWTRLAEHGVTALVTSTLTVTLLHLTKFGS